MHNIIGIWGINEPFVPASVELRRYLVFWNIWTQNLKIEILDTYLRFEFVPRPLIFQPRIIRTQEGTNCKKMLQKLEKWPLYTILANRCKIFSYVGLLTQMGAGRQLPSRYFLCHGVRDSGLILCNKLRKVT